LGVNGISVKSHGSANAYAFSCAINKCYDFVLNDLNKKIMSGYDFKKLILQLKELLLILQAILREVFGQIKQL
jgi:hypothetical protein